MPSHWSERTGARTFAQAASPAVKTSRVNKRFLEKWVSISVTDDSYLRQMCLLQILHRPRLLLCYIETGSPDFPAQLRTASSSWSRLAAASAHRCRAECRYIARRAGQRSEFLLNCRAETDNVDQYRASPWPDNWCCRAECARCARRSPPRF